MMIEITRQIFIELPLNLLEECLAAHAWPNGVLDHREHGGDCLPGPLLRIARLPAHGQRPAVVREIAAERRAKVQNVQLALLAAAVARRPAPGRAGVIVARRSGLRLAELLRRYRLQLIEH